MRSIVQLHGPGIADNGDPGIRSSRRSGPGNDHNACPYRPCGRFGSSLGGRRLYDGDCPVSAHEMARQGQNARPDPVILFTSLSYASFRRFFARGPFGANWT